MSKQMFYDLDARNKLKAGVDKLANAVKVTLGPKGRNVLIGRDYSGPHITKDGVTVAEAISLEDITEDVGAQMVKEVASKTAKEAGDGTTTATILAQSIVNEGLKVVAAGANPMEVKKGIELGVEAIVASLAAQAQPIVDAGQIENVATISANGDNHIGSLIAEAFDKMGKTGVIAVEESKSTETTVEVVEGMRFDRGYLSPYFITHEKKPLVELSNPYILIANKRINNIQQILPVLEMVAQANQPLLIIADEVEGEALNTLVMNKIREILKVAAVKSPGFGGMRKQMLEDIAALTGATILNDDLAVRVEDFTLKSLGRAKSVIIDRDNTTIVDGKGGQDAINKRIEIIKEQIAEADTDYDREIYEERLAKLTSGVGVLYVGAKTEPEMKEKKDRIDDAISATRAAVAEGVVPGGGVAYIKAVKGLTFNHESKDVEIGFNIVKKAVETPLRTILNNAGVEGSLIIEEIKVSDIADFGYNARTSTFENLLTTGVIDPAKVSRVALENAASVASLILTTECVIVDKVKQKQIYE